MAVVWPSKNNFANGDVLTAANMNNIGDTLNVFNPTSATNGQVWQANGSGSGSYATITSGAVVLIASTTASGSVSTITFSSIPATYKHLILWMSHTNATANSALWLRFNNSSTSAYWNNYIQGSNSIVTAARSTSAAGQLSISPGRQTYPVLTICEIGNYTSTSVAKMVSRRTAYEDKTTDGQTWLYSGLWDNTAAINRIDLIDANGYNFVAGSIFSLYGVS
jgi:hypothetical protein